VSSFSSLNIVSRKLQGRIPDVKQAFRWSRIADCMRIAGIRQSPVPPEKRDPTLGLARSLAFEAGATQQRRQTECALLGRT
jgi:hypothetical protein